MRVDGENQTSQNMSVDVDAKLVRVLEHEASSITRDNGSGDYELDSVDYIRWRRAKVSRRNHFTEKVRRA